MILRTRKIAITEQASPDNVVVLTAINEGVDGSAVFGVSNEHSELSIEGGMSYIDSANPSLDVRVLKPSSSDVTQIKSWASNQTNVQVTGLTTNGGFFFGSGSGISVFSGSAGVNPVKISVNEQLSDADVFAFRITKRTNFGFDSNGLHQGGFWAGKNLIGDYNFVDSDSSGNADTWEPYLFTSSFSGGAQTLVNDESGTANFWGRTLFMPFMEEEFTFSLDIDSFNEYGGDYTQLLNINGENASGGVVAVGLSGIATEVTGTGRFSVTLKINKTDVKAIELRFVSTMLSSGTQPAEFTVSNPMLTIDGSTVYSKF